MSEKANKDRTAKKGTNTVEEISLRAREIQEQLPEEVRIALDAMRRIQRMRRTVEPQQIQQSRYFQIS